MSIRLVDIPASEFPDYFTFLLNLYATQTAKAYGWDQARATAYGHEVLSHLLPDGYQTPGARFYRIVAGEEAVGTVWLAIDKDAGDEVAFLRYIHVEEGQRKQGYARQAIEQLKKIIKDKFGVNEMRLNVYGYNTPAIELYESLDFSPLKLTMSTKL